jgi:hypothetical protein
MRLRRLIEGRQTLIRRYGIAYGGVADTLQQVRDGSHSAVSHMSAAQRAEAERHLLSVRDEVARGFTQAITRAENDANELAPGTFPRGDEPFQSFDLGEWADQILDGLTSICEGLSDIFDGIGFGPGAAAMDAAADGLNALERYGEEQGWWQPDPPDNE